MENTRISALSRIISIAHRLSGKAVFYLTSLGTLTLILTNTDPNTLPPVIGLLAGGIGVDLISSTIDRLAFGEKVPDSEIMNVIEKILQDKFTKDILTREDFMYELAKISGGITLQVINQTIEDGHNEIAEFLIIQYEQLRGFRETFTSEFAELKQELDTLRELINQIVEDSRFSKMKPKIQTNRLERFLSKLYRGIKKSEDAKIGNIQIRSSEMVININTKNKEKIFRISSEEFREDNLNTIINVISTELEEET